MFPLKPRLDSPALFGCSCSFNLQWCRDTSKFNRPFHFPQCHTKKCLVLRVIWFLTHSILSYSFNIWRFCYIVNLNCWSSFAASILFLLFDLWQIFSRLMQAGRQNVHFWKKTILSTQASDLKSPTLWGKYYAWI